MLYKLFITVFCVMELYTNELKSLCIYTNELKSLRILAFPFPQGVLGLLQQQEEERVCWEVTEEAQEEAFDAALLMKSAAMEISDIQNLKKVLKPGGRGLILAAPLDSFENRVLVELAETKMLSTKEFKRALKQEGLQIEHFEIFHGAHYFASYTDLYRWAFEEIAPRTQLKASEYPPFVESYLDYLTEIGAFQTCSFVPYEQLIILVRKGPMSLSAM